MSAPKSLHILVAEDNEINQLMAQGTLEQLGHQVTIAEDGRVAVELAKSGNFDLVLMDLVMPNMDGFQAAQAILSGAPPHPPVIAVTATLTSQDEARCRESGMTRWLLKPIDPDEFERLIQPQTPRSPASEALRSRVRGRQNAGKFLELFRQGYPQRLRELRHSVAERDGATARRAAHTLKGNFLNFASELGAQLAHQLEEHIERASWTLAASLLPSLEAACREVESALSELLEEPTGETDRDARHDSGRGFTVLVADVDPANRAICVSALQTEGYRVVEASDGEQVLELLAREPVDVVMMSVVMAHLGGFETCRRIKGAPATRMLPVLLVTALGEREARLEGIEAGADDFISKPIDPKEVTLRVRNAARGKELYDQLQSSFEELQRLEHLRDGLTHMIVHDLRTPLTAIKGYASLLTSVAGIGMNEQQKSFAQKIVNQSNRLVEMVSSILDVSRLESDQMPITLESHDLSQLLLKQAETFSGQSESNLALELTASIHLPLDQELMGRVVMNLLSNAFKYTPAGETVTLRCEQDETHALIQVIDRGPGVPEDYRVKIFEKFAQVDSESHRRPYSSGLGLTFCHLVVEKHQGTIGVREAPGGGSDFWIKLPLVSSASA